MHLSLAKTAKWSRRESRIVLVGVENRLNAQIWILGGSSLNASMGSLSGSNPGLRILSNKVSTKLVFLAEILELYKLITYNIVVVE